MSSSSPLPSSVQPSARRHRAKACLVNGTLAAALVSVSVPGLATSASAAIVEPADWPSPFAVTIFPERDFVSVNWDGSGKELTFDLVRNGVVIGHAASALASPVLRTDVAENLLEVNHPGGLCWAGSTPDILPGDRLEVTESGTTDGVAATTLNVTAQPAEEVGTTVVVHGTAFEADGVTPMDLAFVEQRIINPDFRNAGLDRRDLRATVDDGTLVADPDVPGGWIATYDSLTGPQRALAVAGETRGMAWQDTNAAGDRLGITIYEAGLTGGPGMPECPAQASYSVADATPEAVNASNITSGLRLTGAAQDASSVTITLDDGDSATQPVTATATPTPASGAQSYAVAFTADQVQGLRDGTLTATSSFELAAGGTISGAGTTLLKDTVLPGAPTIDTPSGHYVVPQAVTLRLPAGEPTSSVIRYTTDGSAPTASSPTAQPVTISSSRTLRAAVFDAAGNSSASPCPGSACWNYLIEPALAAPSTPDLASTSDTGQSQTDNVTNATAPLFTGTGTPGATVDLKRGTAVVGSTTVSPNGQWSVRLAGLAAGVSELTAESHSPQQQTRRTSGVLRVTVDRTAPKITAKSPTTATGRARRGANVIVRFGEPVAPLSLNTGTVVLRKATGGAGVRRTLGYSAGTRTLTVNPGGGSATLLAAGTAYRVSLGGGIKDVAGNALSATSWTFRTR